MIEKVRLWVQVHFPWKWMSLKETVRENPVFRHINEKLTLIVHESFYRIGSDSSKIQNLFGNNRHLYEHKLCLDFIAYFTRKTYSLFGKRCNWQKMCRDSECLLKWKIASHTFQHFWNHRSGTSFLHKHIWGSYHINTNIAISNLTHRPICHVSELSIYQYI